MPVTTADGIRPAAVAKSNELRRVPVTPAEGFPGPRVGATGGTRAIRLAAAGSVPRPGIDARRISAVDRRHVRSGWLRRSRKSATGFTQSSHMGRGFGAYTPPRCVVQVTNCNTKGQPGDDRWSSVDDQGGWGCGPPCISAGPGVPSQATPTPCNRDPTHVSRRTNVAATSHARVASCVAHLRAGHAQARAHASLQHPEARRLNRKLLST